MVWGQEAKEGRASSPSLKDRGIWHQKTQKPLIKMLATGPSQLTFAPYSLSIILNIKFKQSSICPLS